MQKAYIKHLQFYVQQIAKVLQQGTENAKAQLDNNY